jgi:hypothetical protein
MRVNPSAAMAALDIQRRKAEFRITVCDKSQIVNILGNFH